MAVLDGAGACSVAHQGTVVGGLRTSSVRVAHVAFAQGEVLDGRILDFAEETYVSRHVRIVVGLVSVVEKEPGDGVSVTVETACKVVIDKGAVAADRPPVCQRREILPVSVGFFAQPVLGEQFFVDYKIFRQLEVNPLVGFASVIDVVDKVHQACFRVNDDGII